MTAATPGFESRLFRVRVDIANTFLPHERPWGTTVFVPVYCEPLGLLALGPFESDVCCCNKQMMAFALQIYPVMTQRALNYYLCLFH